MVDEDEVIARYLGRVGGGRVSRRMKRDTFELSLEATGNPAQVFVQAQEVLRRCGEIIEVDESSNRVFGVVESGSGGLNPAVVTVTVGGSGQVTVRGVAAEGLIKQHAGEKAARTVAAAFELT